MRPPEPGVNQFRKLLILRWNWVPVDADEHDPDQPLLQRIARCGVNCDVHSSDGGCSRTRTCDPLQATAPALARQLVEALRLFDRDAAVAYLVVQEVL